MQEALALSVVALDGIAEVTKLETAFSFREGTFFLPGRPHEADEKSFYLIAPQIFTEIPRDPATARNAIT